MDGTFRPGLEDRMPRIVLAESVYEFGKISTVTSYSIFLPP
jgi:hypothetical protein